MGQLYCKPVETTSKLVTKNVFMYPQFLIDNLFTEYKSYQLLNSSSKEFKIVESIINNKFSIMEHWEINKYCLSVNGLTIRRILVNDKTIYFVYYQDLSLYFQ